MAALKSQCPGCRKILKLKTKAALGKRVPCPQCNKPFIVEEYESPEMVADFIDDDEAGFSGLRGVIFHRNRHALLEQFGKLFHLPPIGQTCRFPFRYGPISIK